MAILGDLAVVTYEAAREDLRNRARAVRLECGPRGWEIVDVPDGDYLDDTCVVEAVTRGGNPFACPDPSR